MRHQAAGTRMKSVKSQSVLSLTSPLTLNKSLNLSGTYFLSLKKSVCVCVCECVCECVSVCVCVCVGGSKKWVIILSLFFLQLFKERKTRKAKNSFQERNQKKGKFF